MSSPVLPVSLGYRMPAEWETHSSTWLAWPHNPETWPGRGIAQVEDVYIDILRALQPGENIDLLVNDAGMSQAVTAKLMLEGIPLERVTLHTVPTNDAWIRDYGPNFLVRRRPENPLAFNKWNFDSWGGKYEWDLDNEAGNLIAGILGVPVFQPGIVLEGGAIEVNGLGTCITTADCLLHPNRNGGLGRAEMERLLKTYLDAEKIIWCHGDLEGDDTDGHIDNLVRFVSPDTVVCAWEEDPADKNHACLKENLEILQTAGDQSGHPLRVIRLPMPPPVMEGGTRLPASYANFYIGNRVVLFPAYDPATDEKVRSLLRPLFPGRKIVPIPSRTLILGLGGIHCITQQQPDGAGLYGAET